MSNRGGYGIISFLVKYRGRGLKQVPKIAAFHILEHKNLSRGAK
jgi:hypothetical protein